MMRRRRAEDGRVLEAVGARLVNLDWLDRQYTDEVRDAEQIAAAVEVAVPGWGALYAPAGVGGYTFLAGTEGQTLDSHPDHVAARQVGLCLERPGVPTYFYGELPYGLGERLERPWPQALEDFTPALEAATGRRLEFTLGELSDAQLARRTRAVSLYETQLRRLEQGVGRSLRDREILRYEALWRSPAPGTARGSRRRPRRHRTPARPGRGPGRDRAPEPGQQVQVAPAHRRSRIR